ncbi:MAG: tRNA (adenosine(37)-N6)-threonylcarbamoyltransferase complex ATPase subunit type 1 TsaE [Bacteroidota bacterium]|nr:tRNA (adenosine(37)-N6)-threonylcarbamoyltransferase complex ATPase subunit type 1 TsaE [Bacteroidota bacterium]
MFTVSIKNLHYFAQTFWQQAGGAKVFLFYGEMGAGKTTIIETLCSAKGVKERMGSPTFSIINQYSYNEAGEEKIIYHIDLYRLKDEEEIIQAGVEECICSGAICFVEWPQKAPDLFDEKSVKVFIEPVDETHRCIKIIIPHAV